MGPPVRAAAPFGVAYRPESEADRPFLDRLYAEAKGAAFAQAGLPPDMLGPLLAQQQRVQHGQYRAAWPDAEFLIVEVESEAAGRLYLHRGPQAVRIVDISLMAAHRGRGLGRAIVEDVIAMARAAGLAVQLSVAADNPARRLYARLGFVADGPEGAYLAMMLKLKP